MASSPERLQLSFTSFPRVKISTSLVAPDDTEIVHSSFEADDCPAEWVEALQSIAAATNFAHFAGFAATSPVGASPSSSPRSQAFEDDDQASPSVGNPQTPTSGSEREDYIPAAKTVPCSRRTLKPLLPAPSTSTILPGVTRVSTPSHSVQIERRWQSSLKDVASTNTLPIQSRTTYEPARSSPHCGTPDAASSPSPSAKRTQKLEAQLCAIRDSELPSRDELNDTVRQLYQHSTTSSGPVTSMEQFGHVLGRLGNVSSTVGFIYTLLSWEIFRWKENMLIHEESQPLLKAAKQVNDEMAQRSSRRAKTKDWASDGRRAAGMVFDSIGHLSIAVQSFALIILAEQISPDGLLRIAHFPVLRERFRTSFNQIVEVRKEEWEFLACSNYLVFDYKQFYHSHVNADRPRDTWPSQETGLFTTEALTQSESMDDIEGMIDLGIYSSAYQGIQNDPIWAPEHGTSFPL